MSAASSAATKNRKAWRDRPDVVLISVRHSTIPVFDRLTARWHTRVILIYQVLGTRAECERENGGAPVDPGIYGPETILTAWDLGLSQRKLSLLAASRALDAASYSWNRRYQAKLTRAVAAYFGFSEFAISGLGGRGQIWMNCADSTA